MIVLSCPALFKLTILFKAAGFKEDFQQERRDREKMHMELTNKLATSQGIARELQQKLIQSIHDKEYETQTLKIAQQKETEALMNQISTLEEVASKLTEEEDKVKNTEEEKLVLTQQVKAYSRQCEELKKTMVQLQETLEKQVYHKERIATEVHVYICYKLNTVCNIYSYSKTQSYIV